MLGFSRSRVYRLLAGGDLEFVQVGGVRRIPADALVAFVGELRGRRDGAEPPSAA